MNSSKLNNHPEQIIVASDAEALTQAAAGFVVKAVNEAIARNERASLSLSGGSTPRTLFKLLATPEWRDKIDWSKVHVFWGDERFVPPNDAQSNFRMANEALLSHVPVPPENVHRFMTEQGNAADVAAECERTIREFFQGKRPEFDLILLGLGTNAHTASLFPNTLLLKETKKLVAAEYIEEVKGERLTFTVPLINAAREACFLVSGGEKAEVVKDVLTGPMDPTLKPAQLIRPTRGRLTWLLDEPAARLIPLPRSQMIILMMGVAGAGKTTAGRALAKKLGCEFLDADSLHSVANIAKMRAGTPLTDEDRWPWLDAVARAIDELIQARRCAVVACSALKQKYRDVLARPEVKLIYLKISRKLAAERARVRHHDYMPASLVESQFADLEEPEDAFVVSASSPVDEAVERIASWIKSSPA